jgi:hypothetical protein
MSAPIPPDNRGYLSTALYRVMSLFRSIMRAVPGKSDLSASAVGRLDETCDRFEDAWQSGQRPRLEDFLTAVEEQERPILFRRLLDVELTYRRQVGEAPTPEEYASRFPDNADFIEVILFENAHQGPRRQPLTERPMIPGYEMLGELGRGGMAIVFMALDLARNRRVAIKTVQPDLSPLDLGRFHAEARAIAQLSHPNIVKIHEVGQHENRPFLVLEFCSGGDLAQKLAQRPCSADESAALLECLARAIHAAHQKGIIHRDLKPGNILFTESGEPRLADFGLARNLGGTGTWLPRIVGTPNYMAPEQTRIGEEIGPAADVYALGAILY